VITAVAQGKATVTNSFLLAGRTEEDKRFENESIELIETTEPADESLTARVESNKA
jgi:hypothetical protein